MVGVNSSLRDYILFDRLAVFKGLFDFMTIEIINDETELVDEAFEYVETDFIPRERQSSGGGKRKNGKGVMVQLAEIGLKAKCKAGVARKEAELKKGKRK